jgi:hypothetical protein
MKIAQEDLLWIRNHIAERYHKELTPRQVVEILEQAVSVEISSQPGLVTLMRMQREAEDK